MKILHLEDNAADAELIGGVIAAEWPGCEITVVWNREDFISRLHEGGQDLVLSDFSLIAFNGLEALELSRQQRPDIPFIFISGTIGEDRAIAALQAGASDYVIKDRMKRLVPSLRRALTASEERKAKRVLEEQLLRVQRTENIGLLASGIAHDLNNVLAPILMAAPMLRDRATDPADVKLLTILEKSAERGAGLVRQILAFAHGASGERQVTSVKHLTEEIVSVVSETFPKAIRFEHRMDPDPWPIKANLTHIHQVLLNLCINARDAMEEGGTLGLSVENEVVSQDRIANVRDGRPGSFLVFEIRDTGHGIPPEVLDRMWEPFFTTKPVGKGTGLGLSTVRGIVENHGGFISVATAPGQGTTFRVYLPAAESAAKPVVEKPTYTLATGKGELVLVVDDEKAIRDLATEILTRAGYRVISANDGAEGMALFSQNLNQVSLVISDMQMPNFNGAILARVIHRIDPALKILAMSGLSQGTREGPSREPVNFGQAFLRKPFTPEKLLDQVHALLHPGE